MAAFAEENAPGRWHGRAERRDAGPAGCAVASQQQHGSFQSMIRATFLALVLLLGLAASGSAADDHPPSAYGFQTNTASATDDAVPPSVNCHITPTSGAARTVPCRIAMPTRPMPAAAQRTMCRLACICISPIQGVHRMARYQVSPSM